MRISSDFTESSPSADLTLQVTAVSSAMLLTVSSLAIVPDPSGPENVPTVTWNIENVNVLLRFEVRFSCTLKKHQAGTM